jgi:hypothetical protein
MSNDLSRLKDWIGKTETVEDRAAIHPVRGYAALMDKEEVPKEGDPIGPMALSVRSRATAASRSASA